MDLDEELVRPAGGLRPRIGQALVQTMADQVPRTFAGLWDALRGAFASLDPTLVRDYVLAMEVKGWVSFELPTDPTLVPVGRYVTWTLTPKGLDVAMDLLVPSCTD